MLSPLGAWHHKKWQYKGLSIICQVNLRSAGDGERWHDNELSILWTNLLTPSSCLMVQLWPGTFWCHLSNLFHKTISYLRACTANWDWHTNSTVTVTELVRTCETLVICSNKKNAANVEKCRWCSMMIFVLLQRKQVSNNSGAYFWNTNMSWY